MIRNGSNMKISFLLLSKLHYNLLTGTPTLAPVVREPDPYLSLYPPSNKLVVPLQIPLKPSDPSTSPSQSASSSVDLSTRPNPPAAVRYSPP